MFVRRHTTLQMLNEDLSSKKVPAGDTLITDQGPIVRHASRSTESLSGLKKEVIPVAYEKETGELQVEIDEEKKRKLREARYQKLRPFILAGTAAVVLGWWISATVLPATRPRWSVVIVFWI